MYTDTGFAPSGRNDAGFYFIALNAEKGWWFVGFVDDAYGNQDRAGFNVECIIDAIVDERLLQFHRTGFRATFDQRVFHFQFGIEAQIVVELVAIKQHETMEVDLVFFVVIAVIVVVQFAVGTERVAPGRKAFHRAGRRRRRRRGCR